jgi:Family of unknown function (DUF6308)
MGRSQQEELMGDVWELVLAGRSVGDPLDRVRRYCGLAWSGGPAETWAYRFYDAVDAGDRDTVAPEDVTVASALHPGLSRAELAWFWDHATGLKRWLAQIPRDAGATGSVDDMVISYVAGLPQRFGDVSLTLLSKVLHRKRPAAIPLIDRATVDWYRPVTGERTATGAWPEFVRTIHGDVARNRPALDAIRVELAAELERAPSALRVADIAIWMGAQR